MTLNAGTLQDLYHYALALQGKSESAFPSDTLRHRLQASDSIYMMLTRLEGNTDCEAYIPKEWVSEDSMMHYGKTLQDWVVEYSTFCGIDPKTGETLTKDQE